MLTDTKGTENVCKRCQIKLQFKARDHEDAWFTCVKCGYTVRAIMRVHNVWVGTDGVIHFEGTYRANYNDEVSPGGEYELVLTNDFYNGNTP